MATNTSYLHRSRCEQNAIRRRVVNRQTRRSRSHFGSSVPREMSGEQVSDGSPEAAASSLVSHYLDHIQPVIDEMVTTDAHLFAELDAGSLPAECAESSEHDPRRMEAFLRFRSRVAAEVDAWCLSQGVSDTTLHEALSAAALAEAEGRETNATILLELLSSAEDYGVFASYMAGEALANPDCWPATQANSEA
eukprot:gnl/TRDRNA2_/TRDRNA2_82497_c0_seq3.p2 gnl/TRDRNA2_/TRDRNA2_82497_c0~~gnl/TRDRNA2_/TRDRNA2_82497_c0_seq3.p2  ORF type:complete len:193 (-),score=45.05 gnl/TRDRNA2_/TRDRNA2_82497_c0_seq3:30-608(-)